MENKSENVTEFLEAVEKSLLLLEPLILFENKQWNSFDIKSHPAVENALLYCSILGETEKLKEIKNVIFYFPELHFYKNDAIQALKSSPIISEVIEYIQQKNGVKSDDLANYLGTNYELVKDRLYYLVKLGILKKSKVGRYNFYEAI